MKTLTKAILLLVLCFIIAGCNQTSFFSPNSTKEPQVNIEESKDNTSSNDIPSEEPVSPTISAETIPDETVPSDNIPESEPAEIPPPTTTTTLIQAVIYYGNDNADGFETKTIQTDELTIDILIQNLIDIGVLSEGTAVLSQQHIDSCLHIDLNSTFRDRICSMGTAGEYIIMGSLVNTILENFKDTTQSVYITVNGEILESGHMVYDFELTRYN